MITSPRKARTDKDGTLSLAIATGLPNSNVEVVVIVEAARSTAAPTNEWPEGTLPRLLDRYGTPVWSGRRRVACPSASSSIPWRIGHVPARTHFSIEP